MAEQGLRVALVEPYLGGSHEAWATGYSQHSAHDVEVFGLPAAHWKWRMQGGHISLASHLEAAVTERGGFDVALASSMTNVSALLGVARRSLVGARVVLFMHENQLTYPWSAQDREDLTYAMINWTSMVASDVVVFNSQYHRSEWFGALPRFLGRFPDQRHTRLIGEVRQRSTVLPVGADLRALDHVGRTVGVRPLVIWNQRWEYDKGPTDFAVAIEAFADEGIDFDVALAGERPADDPPDLVRLRELLGERLVHDGYADLMDYRALLRRADVVVSTAQHEFFGVAVTEAVYAGAFPVLPNRLVYRERIPVEHHAACLYDNDRGLIGLLRWAITHRAEAQAIAAALRSSMAESDWSQVAPRYDRVMDGCNG